MFGFLVQRSAWKWNGPILITMGPARGYIL